MLPAFYPKSNVEALSKRTPWTRIWVEREESLASRLPVTASALCGESVKPALCSLNTYINMCRYILRKPCTDRYALHVSYTCDTQKGVCVLKR